MSPLMQRSYKLHLAADKTGVKLSRDGGKTLYVLPRPVVLNTTTPSTPNPPPPTSTQPPTDLRVFQLSRNTRRSQQSLRVPSKFVEEPLVSTRSARQFKWLKSLQSPVVAPSDQPPKPQEPPVAPPIADQAVTEPPELGHELGLLSLLNPSEGPQHPQHPQQPSLPLQSTVEPGAASPTSRSKLWNPLSLPPPFVPISSVLSSDVLPQTRVARQNRPEPTSRPRERFGPSRYSSAPRGQYGHPGAHSLAPTGQLQPGHLRNRAVSAGQLMTSSPLAQSVSSASNLLTRSLSTGVQFRPLTTNQPPPAKQFEPSTNQRSSGNRSELSQQTHGLVPGMINAPGSTVSTYREIEQNPESVASNSNNMYGNMPFGMPPGTAAPGQMPETMSSRQSQSSQSSQSRGYGPAAPMYGAYGNNVYQPARMMGPPGMRPPGIGPPAARVMGPPGIGPPGMGPPGMGPPAYFNSNTGYSSQSQASNSSGGPNYTQDPSIRNGSRPSFPQPLGRGYPVQIRTNTQTQTNSQQQLPVMHNYVRDANGNFIVNHQHYQEPQFRAEQRQHVHEPGYTYAQHQAQIQAQLAMAQARAASNPGAQNPFYGGSK